MTYGSLRAHSAGTYQEGDGTWRASCAQCGWFSKRTYASQERGQRAADRHVTSASEADRQAYMALYGPKPVTRSGDPGSA